MEIINFATDNKKGKVEVHATRTTLTLKQCNNIPCGVNSDLPNDFIPEWSAAVELHFYTSESVDVVIKALECIKRNLNNPNWALAC
jgi:hypothetical protein